MRIAAFFVEVHNMNVKQISVCLDNGPGTLYSMTNVFADKGISIRALTVAQSSDTSTVRIIVDNVIWASSVLRNMGFDVTTTDVVAVEVPNIPGGLNQVLKVIKDGYVNIEYLYAVGSKYAHNLKNSCIIFKFTDNEQAIDVLTSAGIRLLCHGDLATL